MAVASCLKNKAIPPEVSVFGEVGLSGEVRSVGQPLARVKESHSLGFETVILPQGSFVQISKEDVPPVKLIGVENIRQALKIIF
jgi:DNA repair protein RadA/Sms